MFIDLSFHNNPVMEEAFAQQKLLLEKPMVLALESVRVLFSLAFLLRYLAQRRYAFASWGCIFGIASIAGSWAQHHPS